MQKAVFLDRDGVVNREVNYLKDINQLRLLPNAATAVKKLNIAGYLTIIVANQAVVARGLISEEKLEKIHAELLRRIKRKGGKIDAIYYCPHHPNANMKGYRIDCEDRKPNTGLIKKAVKKFGIDLRKSYLVGDQTRDVQTAKNAGIKSILVRTGYAGGDRIYNVKPDYIADNLLDASEHILKSDFKTQIN